MIDIKCWLKLPFYELQSSGRLPRRIITASLPRLQPRPLRPPASPIRRAEKRHLRV